MSTATLEIQDPPKLEEKRFDWAGFEILVKPIHDRVEALRAAGHHIPTEEEIIAECKIVRAERFKMKTSS